MDKARESALLAVEIYNKPSVKFRTGGFITLMVIAWTAFFHAYYLSRKVKPYYREKNSRRYKKIEGDYKHWELSTCLQEFFKDQSSPVKDNLRFLIKLRNKIEHRSIPELDAEVFGEAQASILNFEQYLIKHFGSKYSINSYLTFPIHVSDEPKRVQLRATAGWKQISEFVQSYRSSLSTDVLSDNRFSFQVYLVPKLSNRETKNTIAVEFVQYDPTKPEEMLKYEKVTALIKEKQVEVLHSTQYKPGKVVELLNENGCTDFTAGDHVKAWKKYKIRPKSSSVSPERCNNKYCIYDVAHKDYVYTDKWIEFLKLKWEDPEEKRAIRATPNK